MWQLVVITIATMQFSIEIKNLEVFTRCLLANRMLLVFSCGVLTKLINFEQLGLLDVF